MSQSTQQLVESIFHDMPRVTVIRRPIQSTSAPAIVSAGNSFAEMNGGVDGIINTFLSSHTPEYYIQDVVKETIWRKWAGELPVGSSECVPTNGHPVCSHLIYTPTMRVAETLPPDTLNPYLAFRSSCLCALHNQLHHIATPLFCTGAGNVSVETSARQMKAALQTIENQTFAGGNWQRFHQHHRHLHRL